MKRALIVMAKAPDAKSVKTRLAGALSDGERLALYMKLLDGTISKMRGVSSADLYINNSPAGSEDFFGPRYGLPLIAQRGDDIGQRMHNAIADALAMGYGSVALVGVDIPGLTASIVERAFDLLDGVDVVFGPAEDGGYYLVAMRAAHAGLFDDIRWSTAHTLADTLARAKGLGLNVAQVDRLFDIDRPEDLRRYQG